LVVDMAEITKISTKGQVVIPNSIRSALKLAPGDTLQIEMVGDLVILKKVELKPLKAELGRAAGGGKR
jgi:AbrB family looped-hinge helix DNA binding protein